MLNRFALKYGTDKANVYCNYYDSLLKSRQSAVKQVMEIGVFHGASVMMWHDYFRNATIHGVDSFEGVQGNGKTFTDATDFYKYVQTAKPKRIQLHKADQSDDDQLRSLRSQFQDESFDIIVDDGSHKMRDQQRTFEILFPLLKVGGIYIIEDLNSSLPPINDAALQYHIPAVKHTTLDAVTQLMVNGTYEPCGEVDFDVKKEARVMGTFLNYKLASRWTPMTCAIERVQSQ